MSQANIDLGLLQDTKITDRVCVWESEVFCVIALDAPRHHRQGMALVYKYSLQFAVDYHQQRGPNVISFQLVMGEQRWHVFSCYLVPHDTSTLERVIAEISHRPRGANLFITGNFSTYLELPDGNKLYKEIAAAMAMEGLKDMTDRFLPCKLPWTQDGRT